MKLWTSLGYIALCLALLICCAGCSNHAPDATDPTGETKPPVDPRVLYAAAVQAIDSSPHLRLVISYDEQRIVNGETYTQSSNAMISYANRDTAAPSAVVEENLTFGTYENTCKTYYTDGTAYTQIMNYAFSTPMAFPAFYALHPPAVLLDAALYSTVTEKTGLSGTTLYFSDPSALENWIDTPTQAELIRADGTALINKSGRLLSSDYSAQYRLGETEYAFSVTVTVATPEILDLSSQYPPELAAATPLSYYHAPRKLLQAVGDICTSQNLTAEYIETLDCEAADSIRKQQVQVTANGKDETLFALVDYAATLTNYAGTSSVNTQKVTFENGTCSNSVNGSTPNILQSVTSEQMRTHCEDTILSALLSIDYVSGAQLVEDSNTYTLQLSGTEAMAEDLCDSIYTILNTDLDSTADSYNTNRIGGYLTIEKATGLPVEAGIYLTRIHVIGGASYTMTYELSETIALPVQ